MYELAGHFKVLWVNISLYRYLRNVSTTTLILNPHSLAPG